MDRKTIWSNVVGTGLDPKPLENKVESVNGKTGTVNLSAEDVGAFPAKGSTTAHVRMSVLNSNTVNTSTLCLKKTDGSNYASILCSEKTANGKTPITFNPHESAILRGLADPEQDNDAANKRFVLQAIDEAFGGLLDGKY